MIVTFTNELKRSRYDELLEYLRGPRLWLDSVRDYPDHEKWLQRAYSEMVGGTKRVMVAMDGKTIVGATIYQRHKEKPGLLELKNITVQPEQRGRYIASFLLRNTEMDGARQFNASAITFDAKARNTAFRQFVIGRHGYNIARTTTLYANDAGSDHVYMKPLSLQGR